MTSVPMIDIKLFCWTVHNWRNQDFFPSFCPILDKRHLSRLHKGRSEVQKNTQLEIKGLQSLKIDDDNSPHYRYGNILLSSSSFSCICLAGIWPYFTRIQQLVYRVLVFTDVIWFNLSFCYAITLWAISFLIRLRLSYQSEFERAVKFNFSLNFNVNFAIILRYFFTLWLSIYLTTR